MANRNGSSGNDTIVTGSEDDSVWGQAGDDSIRMGDGDDVGGGGAGNDTVFGEAGNDSTWGDAGNDSLFGGAGNDVLGGGDGRDTLDGGTGNDTFGGGAGNDLILGREGDDLFGGDGGNDTIYAGDGNDSGGGGTGDDLIFGEDGDDAIGGEAGRDTIHGGEGHDGLGGGEDDDLVYGGPGNDEIGGDGGNDTIYGDAGGDSIGGGADNDLIDGGAGNDHVGGGDGDDTVKGGIGDDHVFGDAGNDALFGDEGADRLIGGTGDDTMAGGAGADGYEIEDGDGHDVITDFDVVNDHLAFDMAEISNFRDVRARMSQDGEDTLFSFDNGDTLRLLNVFNGDLRPANVKSVNGPICLCAGMPVETVNGPVLIEHLKVGDMVLTRDGGAAPIRAILHETRAFVGRDDRRRPVLIGAGALGDGVPLRDVRVSPQHRVMLRDPASGEDVLLPACKLVGRSGIRRMRGVASAEYYNILLDTHEVLDVAGLPVESLLVTPFSMSRLSAAEQAVWRTRPAMAPARRLTKTADGLCGVAFALAAGNLAVCGGHTPARIAAE